MANELILLIKALINFSFIHVIFRLDRHFLFAAIILNLLLVSVFGAKLISIFGFITNSGNIFYAAVFFATQLLTEQYGKKDAYKSIIVGAISIVFFILMAQLSIFKIGQPETAEVDYALNVLFEAAPRVALASLIAYIVAQYVNINLFSYLREKTQGKLLYLRVNLSNITGQFVDSVLFFTIAFAGTVSAGSLLQLIVVGYLVKVAVGALSTPFFYLSNTEKGVKE